MEDSYMTTSAVAVDKPAHIPWWLVLLQGVLAVILALFLFANPFATARAIVWVIAWYWLITGVLTLLRLFVDRSHWGWKVFSGIIGILAGWVLLDAGAAERTLLFGWTIVILLGVQGIIMGIIQLIEAFRGGGWGPGVIGGLSILFGILLLSNSMAATVVLPWVIGVFMLVGGIFAIIMAFRLKSAGA
jgi:uncharacterized membrane protein HdeD (DUF308 family)